MDYAKLAAEARRIIGNRSAWSRGVQQYATELVESLEEHSEYLVLEGKPPITRHGLQAAMLNGAMSWREYSEGGGALVYDADIADRLCTPSELRLTRNGEKEPNNTETWLQVQGRALYQAANAVARAWPLLAVHGEE